MCAGRVRQLIGDTPEGVTLDGVKSLTRETSPKVSQQEATALQQWGVGRKPEAKSWADVQVYPREMRVGGFEAVSTRDEGATHPADHEYGIQQ